MPKRAKKIANEIMTDHGRGMSINKQRIKELVDIAIHEDESLAKS